MKTPNILQHLLLGPINRAGNLPPKIYLTSLAVISVLIFLHLPISLVVGENAGLEGISRLDFLGGAILNLVIALAVLGGIYMALPKPGRGLLCVLSLYGALSSLAYAFVFVGNYGAIDSYTIQLEEQLYDSSQVYVDLLVAGFISLAVWWIARPARAGALASGLNGILATLVLSTLVSLFFLSQQEIPPAPNAAGKELPPVNSELLNFSRHGRNVVVLMLDMLSGDAVEAMLDVFPKTKKELDGFTWYRNTMSVANNTVLGEIVIRGGHRFNPREINGRDVVSLREEAIASYGPISSAFKQAGYHVAMAGVPSFFGSVCNDIVSRWPGIDLCEHSIAGGYLGYYLHRNESMNRWYSGSTPNPARNLSVIGVFKSAPYFLRKYIYADGAWLGLGHEVLSAARIRRKVKSLSFLDSMHTASHADSTTDTFKYIRSFAPHYPFELSPYCRIIGRQSHRDEDRIQPRQPGDPLRRFEKQATCAVRSVIRWLHWLEEAGIYDNTKVVIVSDHGYGKQSVGLSRAHAALLVKDFGERGPLRIDNHLLSNADVPAIACDAIGSCKGIIQDPTKHPIRDRLLWYSMGPWTADGHEHDRYSITGQYTVKGSIFSRRNWKRIK
jgi:YidC/Oxa1 family membrane protein insertase